MLQALRDLEDALGFDPSYIALDTVPNRLQRALTGSRDVFALPMAQGERVRVSRDALCAALSRYFQG